MGRHDCVDRLLEKTARWRAEWAPDGVVIVVRAPDAKTRERLEKLVSWLRDLGL